ncbi:uncharacterized protein Hap1MRO34_004204 [Clarias gariepinus]
MTPVLPAIIKYFVMVLGNTMSSHKTFLDHLLISTKLCEVFLVKDSDVIIAFVPIVSRAGTDISAAMEKIPMGNPVVLVVLHHTFDPYYMAPDSKLCVKRDRVFVVDCLYYEDQGFLRCPRNDEAIRAVREHLRIEDQVTIHVKPVEDSDNCNWIWPVIGCTGGIILGVGASIPLSHVAGAIVGVVVGIIAGGTLIIITFVVWVKYR